MTPLSTTRRQVAAFTDIHRPSASPGERQAAELLVTYFEGLGLDARIETEQVHGHYWLPLALLNAVSFATSLGTKSSGILRRLFASLSSAFSIAGLWDDITGGEHHVRKLLPKKDTSNVIASLGPDDTERTIVFIAHHDAARSGAIFNPAIPEWVARQFLNFTANNTESPPVMFPVITGPILTALGAITNRNWIRRLGQIFSLGTIGVLSEIGSREVVPGANDNITGVVTLMQVADRLAAEPLDNARVIFLSTGSEESLMEGMHRYAQRHFDELDTENTFMCCVDTVGSGKLALLDGEGMLKKYYYPERAVSLVKELAAEADIPLRSDLFLRNATDGLYALKGGYPSAMIGSLNEYNAPANYHWPSDTAENVDYHCLDQAIDLCEQLARRLDRTWL